VAYGLQTLRDLLPLPGAKALALTELTIVDAPRFGYRGFQLDVARNFHGKQTVFKWLDLMARYKLNTFHFHLTDDEGWRLEIAGLPELTSIGAVRGHSAKPGVRLQPAYGSGPDPKDPSGSGYFTRADYIEILRYAKARHIEVIPEIEMPGHARAAVQAMEARYHRLTAAGRKDAAKYLLNDFDDRSVYRSAQYFTDNVMNPGLDSSFTFIEHVVAQVVALHREAGVPLRTIHMGGDELANGAWEQSPASLARMRREGLESTADLWDYFYDRVDGILRKHGVSTSGWEELAARKTRLAGRSKLIPNPRFTQRGFTAWVWNNSRGAEDFANRLANAGYDIVLAPVSAMYLDMAANPNPEEPGVNWNDYVELDTVYDFTPLRHAQERLRRRAHRQGRPDRLRQAPRARAGGDAVHRDRARRRPHRLPGDAAPAGGGGTGLGRGSRLGDGSGCRQGRRAAPHGVVGLRECAGPARAAASRPGRRRRGVPHCAAGPDAGWRPRAGQPRPAGHHHALHQRRQRADRRQQTGGRADRRTWIDQGGGVRPQRPARAGGEYRPQISAGLSVAAPGAGPAGAAPPAAAHATRTTAWRHCRRCRTRSRGARSAA
jgi:hypothetical protein